MKIEREVIAETSPHNHYNLHDLRSQKKIPNISNDQNVSNKLTCYKTFTDEENVYNLVGEVKHSGKDLAGHYIILLKSTNNNIWYKINDRNVNFIDFEKYNYDEKYSNSYFLLYEREDPVEMSLVSSTAPVLSPTVPLSSPTIITKKRKQSSLKIQAVAKKREKKNNT